MVLHCIVVIVYIALVKPFELPMLNRLEVFNEVCIIGAAYHLLLFTEYVSDPELQYSIGWSIIGVTVLNIAVNMIIMLKMEMMEPDNVCISENVIENTKQK